MSYRLTKKTKGQKICPACKLNHKPYCVKESEFCLAIVKKDKFSIERIPDAEFFFRIYE